jgi:hypothetical protein
VRYFVIAMMAAVCVCAVPTAANAESCGHVTYHYRAGGRYHAVFAGLDYHSGIYARHFRCRDAQHFVRDYARAGFSDATYRNDLFPPGSIDGFHCHRVRDGDDSGRNYCVRRSARVFFSDSDGIFG